MRAFLLLSVLLAAGCASAPPMRELPPEPVASAPEPSASGSIYGSGGSGRREIGLFQDVKARNVGDTLTVLLVERTQAQKSASTNTTKENSMEMASPTLFGKTISDASISIDANREFSGGGASSQSNRLDGSVSVTVIERLANGNLRIEGAKQIRINQGDETVRISGIVRPVDIAPDNTVASSRVAEARIVYGGRGALADSNAQGWLSRFFHSPFWPF